MIFIRSGITQSGREGRFLGRIDEPLSKEGEMDLRWRAAHGIYPGAEIVFASGLTRARETAEIAYPQIPLILLKELEPYDYGRLSGKNYGELEGDEQFLTWQASGGAAILPDAESPEGFSTRCAAVFRKITREARQKGLSQMAVVTHLSVIKTILQKFHTPRPIYQDWHVGFGGGFAVRHNTASGALQVAEKF